LNSIKILQRISLKCQYVIVLKRLIEFIFSQNYTAALFSVAIFL
jgi:hypothetical protein